MKITWTRHAVERCVEMLGPEGRTEVEEAVTDPEISYRNPVRHGPGTVFVRGRLAVPVDPEGRIYTVLWHRADGRYDDDGKLQSNATTDRPRSETR